MNLFLLTAVPLAAVVFHRLFFPTRSAFSEPKVWILGFVWSILPLLAVVFLGDLREFDGDLVSVAAGLTLEALLVPGAVTAAWLLSRKNQDPWELGLWLTIAFSLAGVRDFAATSRVFEIHELFLVPLARILVILLLPALIHLTRHETPRTRILGWALGGSLLLSGPLFQVLWYARWGWLAAILEIGILVVGLMVQKKAASPALTDQESGSTEPMA